MHSSLLIPISGALWCTTYLKTPFCCGWLYVCGVAFFRSRRASLFPFYTFSILKLKINQKISRINFVLFFFILALKDFGTNFFLDHWIRKFFFYTYIFFILHSWKYLKTFFVGQSKLLIRIYFMVAFIFGSGSSVKSSQLCWMSHYLFLFLKTLFVSTVCILFSGSK